MALNEVLNGSFSSYLAQMAMQRIFSRKFQVLFLYLRLLDSKYD